MSEQQEYIQSPPNKSSTLAVISLIMGILAWIFLPVIGSITAVITGHLAKKEIRASGWALTGDGLATAGLVLGYIQLGVIVVAGVVIILLAIAGPIMENRYDTIINSI